MNSAKYLLGLVSSFTLFVVVSAAISSCSLVEKRESIAAVEPVQLDAGFGDRWASAPKQDVDLKITVQNPSNFFIWDAPNGAYVQFSEFKLIVYYSGGVIYENPAVKTENDSIYHVAVRADSIFRNDEFIYKVQSGGDEIRVGTYGAAGSFEFISPGKDAWAFDFPEWVVDIPPDPAGLDTLIGNKVTGVWTHPAPENGMYFKFRWISGNDEISGVTYNYKTASTELAEGLWTLAVAAVDSVGNRSSEGKKSFYLFRATAPDTTAPPPPVVYVESDSVVNIIAPGRHPLQINVQQ